MLRGAVSGGDRIALLFSILAGILIWIASPFLTGAEEPWDAKGPYYLAGVFMSGGIAGFLGKPRNFWLWPIALWFGQSLFGLYTLLRDLGLFPGGSAGMNFFFPLGLIGLAMFSIPAFLGSASGAFVRKSAQTLFARLFR